MWKVAGLAYWKPSVPWGFGGNLAGESALVGFYRASPVSFF